MELANDIKKIRKGGFVLKFTSLCFEEETKQYNRRDFLLACILYLVTLIALMLLGFFFLIMKAFLSQPFIFLATGFMNLGLLTFVFVLMQSRRQKLSSIGVSLKEVKPSFLLGLVSMGIVVFFFTIIHLILGSKVQTEVGDYVYYFLYYLLEIAFFEEILFRGFIGPRIYGYFRNKHVAIALTGLFFVLYHLPFQIVFNNSSPLTYLMDQWPNLIIIFGLHYIFHFLYAKFNHILAPTMVHFAWDYIQWIFR